MGEIVFTITMKNDGNVLNERTTPVVSEPLFLSVSPSTIQSFETIEEFSPLFVSVVSFVERGYLIDDTVIKHACVVLDKITRNYEGVYHADKILSKLVPRQNDSCAGFTESLIKLLTCSNAALFESAISLLDYTVQRIDHPTQFDFLASGFFKLLPPAFFEHEMHLIPYPKMCLMSIVHYLLFCSTPKSSAQICQQNQFSIDTFDQTFIDTFFHPIEPFLNFICLNRHRIEETYNSSVFTHLLGDLILYSPYLEQMTQFVLSSSLAMTYTNSIIAFEKHNMTLPLLLYLLNGLRNLDNDEPAVRKRRKQILRLLNEEGLPDHCGLRLKWVDDDPAGYRAIFVGESIVDRMGGNVPFVRSRDEDDDSDYY